jgi:hypothetical protein
MCNHLGHMNVMVLNMDYTPQ